MHKFLTGFLHFVFGLGYFGPLLMGMMDSSFLVLPFGNDLVVVGMVVAHQHEGTVWYVLSAACGSTIGVLLLALVARKLGEEGIRKVAGERRFENLRRRVEKRAGLAVAAAALAPPPFPFTVVIATVAALGYPIWRMLIFNFCARALRFAVLAILALKFGQQVMQIAKSPAFQWSMIVFIALCAVASGLSLWKWWGKARRLTRTSASAQSAA